MGLYNAFVNSVLSQPTGMLFYRDQPPLYRRHRKMLRRAVGRKRAREAWRMLIRSNVIAWWDGDPRDKVKVALFDNDGPPVPDGGTVTVRFDPSGVFTID